jgi:glucokinase
MTAKIIGVDLGGTRIRAACLDHDLNILNRQETLTLANAGGPDAVIGRMIDLIRSIWPDEPVAGIGVSSPGPLDPNTGVVLAPPNLTGWKHVPLAARLNSAFGVPVYIGKDTNVAVLAETARGAAQGCRDVVYITLSTGIGAGVLVDGRLLLGHGGLATEVGSMLMLIDGKAMRFEAAAAGPALAQNARERLQHGVQSFMVEMVGGDWERVNTKTLGKAAQQGDALALEIVERAGYIIGLGLTTVLHLFNPEIMVIGGGVSNIGEPLFTPLHRTIREHVIYDGYINTLRIEQAALGEDVSIIGGAALVRTKGGLVPLLEA